MPAAEPRTGLEPSLRPLYERVFGGDFGATPLWFKWTVLDAYRGRPGWRVIRTNSAGRVSSPDGWSLDFGIVDEAQLVHAGVADVSQRLPKREQSHWLEHLVAPGASRNFVLMRLGAAACIDDGDLRDWQD